MNNPEYDLSYIYDSRIQCRKSRKTSALIGLGHFIEPLMFIVAYRHDNSIGIIGCVTLLLPSPEHNFQDNS